MIHQDVIEIAEFVRANPFVGQQIFGDVAHAVLQQITQHDRIIYLLRRFGGGQTRRRAVKLLEAGPVEHVADDLADLDLGDLGLQPVIKGVNERRPVRIVVPLNLDPFQVFSKVGRFFLDGFRNLDQVLRLGDELRFATRRQVFVAEHGQLLNIRAHFGADHLP